MFHRRSLTLTIILALVVPTATVMATHGPAYDASFDPVPGNEWWVEVYVDSNEPLAGVDARADGGDWVALEHRDWGAWAKSFHVPEGSIVEFRARATTADSEISGCYRWTGAEATTCPDAGGDEGGGGDAGGDDGTFAAAFDPVPGNEWWVEVYVDGDEPVAGVEARGDDGAWHMLTERDWGAWAASFHVPEGTILDFRATSTGGAKDMSGCYRWTAADPVTCPDGRGEQGDDGGDDGGDGGGDGDGGGTDAFDVAFAPKGGADDWVEVIVDSIETNVTGVEARVDGGAWQPLELRPWHAWAASMSAPAGSDVEFRATDETGATAISIPYRWTEAEPSDGHGGGFEATFHPKSGNEWWVEVFVEGNEEIALVQANVDDGDWRDLERRTWGAWAASFHVPSGSSVQFRAVDHDGETDVSGEYRWPDATKLSDAPAHQGWPHEGSYAVYEFSTGFAAHTGGPITVGNITFIYHDEAWQVHCLGYTQEQFEGGDREPYSERGTYPPPQVDRETEVGERLDLPSPGCGTGAFNPVEVQGQETRDTRHHGEPVTMLVWHGSYIPDCRCYEDWGYWDVDMGLVHSVGHAGSHSGNRALLEDTDAPITTAGT